MVRSNEESVSAIREWLFAVILAIPIFGLYVTWNLFGGWLWTSLFMIAVIALVLVGVWDLYRGYCEDEFSEDE